MNNKGFSMIELLAVIVVLGIICTIGITAVLNMTDKSKEEYYKIQNENFAMAAQSFVNANRNFLPKEIGGVNKIYLDKLIQMKYIKENIYDQNKEPCDPNKSYVSIFKVSETEYKYVGYLNCPSCKTKDNYCAYDSNEKPMATVKLDSVKDANNVDQIKKATCSITMKGNESGNKKIFSYSYKIFTNEVLKYSSGTIRTSKTSLSFNLNDLVSQYTPGKVRVILSVTNEDGYTKTVSDSYSYGDTTKPHCGKTTDEGTTKLTDEGVRICNDDQWVRSRDMFIMCDDVHGVGCKMHEFSEHFTRESKPYGLDSMKIYDTSENDYDCPVYTCIDLTPPEMVIEMYKNDKNEKPTGKPIRTFNVNKVEADQDLGWFNTDYPKGVSFKIKVKDKVLLKSYKAQYNDSGIYMSAAEKNKFKNNSKGNVDNYYKLSYETNSSLIEEGRRYIKFQAFDGAGNESSIVLKLEIDRTAPTLKIDVGRCGDRNDTNCRNYASPTDTSSATAKQGDLEKTINKKSWLSKGLKISYNTTDHNSLTNVWSWDKQYSMTTAGDATKANSFGSSTLKSNNEDVKLDGTVALTGTGQRQGIMTATDPAGNSVKVTINVYVANICTITFDPNGGTFGANSSAADRTWKIDYTHYVGDTNYGLPNAVGSSSNFKGTRNYYSIDSNKHWNTSSTGSGGTIFDESKSGDNRYKAQNMCSGMTDGKDKTVTLYANWRPNVCTMNFDPNGGVFNTTYSTTQKLKYGQKSTNFWNANGGTYNANRDYYHIDGVSAWKNSDTAGTNPINENENVDNFPEKICSSLVNGDQTVTLYANWKDNTCSITYSPNGGKFNKNGTGPNGTGNVAGQVLKYNQQIGDDEHGMYNARGDAGHFYATKSGNVVAAWGEWNTKADGKGKALDQDIYYTAEELCPNIRTVPNTPLTLYVNWKSSKQTHKIYYWEHLSDKDDCTGYKKRSGDGMMDTHPYRAYIFFAYKCTCTYSDNYSYLSSAEAYLAKHTSATINGVDCSKSKALYKEATDKQKANCFPVHAYIFYRSDKAESKGIHACQGDSGYEINQYVYRVCSNGDVYNHKDTHKYFHGAHWYWTDKNKETGKYYKTYLKDHYLLSGGPKKAAAIDEDRIEDYLIDKNTDIPDTAKKANDLSADENPNSKVQQACSKYCANLYGNPRGSDDDYDYIDDDE